MLSQIETEFEFRFLSDLYALDAPDAVLLAEYPSSNSEETTFRNDREYLIHDPFPPPAPELLKHLGPHHLMCGWGSQLNVTSQVQPPSQLLNHWKHLFGKHGCPGWQPYSESDRTTEYVTLFPHQSVSSLQQTVDPAINYHLHSKEIIEEIDCPQAEVLDRHDAPCIVKLSHGYAGLGNYFIRSLNDEISMREEIKTTWPTATLVANSIIPDIRDDFGVQFYLRKDGTVIWLGLTEQNFDDNTRWCGGTYSHHLQTERTERLAEIVVPTAKRLQHYGYFGVVGVDILTDHSDNQFLVDVNPRLTGISPFLIASRIFAETDGLTEGTYLASQKFNGTYEALIEAAEAVSDAKVMVLSAVETGEDTTCHISVSSDAKQTNLKVIQGLFS